MNTINLSEKRDALLALGTQLFDYLTGLPQDIRPDKKRTGIQILLRWEKQSEVMMIPIYEPSERAQFFSVEKSVRTELSDNVTSQDNENEKKNLFRGCITIEIEEQFILHISVSGLFGTEDVACAVILGALATNMTVAGVVENIAERGGNIPYEFYEKEQYISKFLDKYYPK